MTFWLFPGLPPTVDLEVTSDAAGARVMRHTTRLSGSMAYGPANNPPSQLLARSCFLWLLRCMFGGCDGSRSTFSVVSILYARMSRVLELMPLVQHLLVCAARFHFTFAAQHIRGVHSSIADALSWFNCQEFQQLALGALPSPTTIPEWLLSPLETQCRTLLTHGLASSTRRFYTQVY